ncbi:hypothetical protein [Prosthecobacter sp.]|uniref:hypothetical protein n=1 Tax=Prosthecobacter sp. TaxID=1965333 RepID=UPI00248A7AC2|nr:hypothetical protein [Prosthecobacter sp.]MDI1315513.1 hypothetical protein [Prosthecobacter sp.]
MKTFIQIAASLIASSFLGSCATNDNPPCRKVSAQEFMRPHTFKGIASDRFIGITKPITPSSKSGKAYKEIWEMGLFYGWAVIWIPVEELPPDYIARVHQQPNRSERR